MIVTHGFPLDGRWGSLRSPSTLLHGRAGAGPSLPRPHSLQFSSRPGLEVRVHAAPVDLTSGMPLQARMPDRGHGFLAPNNSMEPTWPAGFRCHLPLIDSGLPAGVSYSSNEDLRAAD